MKISDAWQAYYEFSGKTSELSRNLSFAGMAIIWIFKVEASAGISSVPKDLLIAGFFFALSLASDLLQYASSALVWGQFARKKEIDGTDRNSDFLAPPSINHIPTAFFWSKFAFVLIGYVFLMAYFIGLFGRS